MGEFRLSEIRAKFIYDHLIKSGISDDRMTYKGFAQTRHLQITLKDRGREVNNCRLEIMIISK